MSDIVIQETRCPFCHENVIAGKDDQHGCQKCRAWHHVPCWEEHGGCSTCGFRDKDAEDNYQVKLRMESITVGTEAYIERRRKNQRNKEFLENSYILAADEIKNSPEFEEVYTIVKANSRGKIYLVGGKVYRTLASVLHDSDKDDYKPDAHGEESCDWDFLVEGWADGRFAITDKWCYKAYEVYGGSRLVSPYEIKKEGVGLVRFNKTTLRRDNDIETRFKKDKDEVLCKIDMMNINKINWIMQNRKNPSWYQFWKGKLPPVTLEDYFNAVPMTIQAIAFDPKDETIVGPVGLKAIIHQEVGINNIRAIEDQARRERLEVSDIIRKKARSLPGFSFNPRPDPKALARVGYEDGKSPRRKCGKCLETWDAREQIGCQKCREQADAKRAWEKELNPYDV